MVESKSHKRAKAKAAGPGGQTEVPLSKNRRLDALTAGGGRATEIEMSGDPSQLKKAARRLKASRASQKVLQIPDKDMEAASNAMRTERVPGTVKNLGGTRKRRVRRPKE
jgi:hypothetical protein